MATEQKGKPTKSAKPAQKKTGDRQQEQGEPRKTGQTQRDQQR